jgi:hypothetical protein
MAENVNVTPPSGEGGNGGLYFVVGALLAVVLVGGFLLFGNPNSRPATDVARTNERNVTNERNITIERPAPTVPTAPANPAPPAAPRQ